MGVVAGGFKNTELTQGGPHARKRGKQMDIYKVGCFEELPLHE